MAGIGNNYSFLFNSNSNNLAGLTNSLFGGSSNMLGDYAMIKSGTYKKLLTAYYKTQKTDSGDTEKADTSKRYNRFDRTEKKEEQTEAQKKAAETKKQFLEVKTEAGDLRSAAYSLNSYTLYNEKTAEDGTKSYDRDAIKKAVKNYVSDYNNLLTASSKVSSSGISSNVSGIVKLTNDRRDQLSAIGISIGKDNKLTLDEEKLGSADVDAISALFKGNASYGSSVASRSTEIARQANSSAYSVTRASASYSQRGSYSVMGNSNNMLNQLF